jgi:hypothetical protein
MGVGTLYTAVAVLGVALRVRTTAVAVHSLPGHVRSTRGFAASAWETLHSHPAQSSIGWDVIWTTLSFAAWILLGSHHGSSPITVPALVVANLLGSVGVTAPVFFFGGVDNTGEFKRVD